MLLISGSNDFRQGSHRNFISSLPHSDLRDNCNDNKLQVLYLIIPLVFFVVSYRSFYQSRVYKINVVID